MTFRVQGFVRLPVGGKKGKGGRIKEGQGEKRCVKRFGIETNFHLKRKMKRKIQGGNTKGGNTKVGNTKGGKVTEASRTLSSDAFAWGFALEEQHVGETRGANVSPALVCIGGSHVVECELDLAEPRGSTTQGCEKL